MKKLLYFLVSMLSLAIIFAAGWASAAGKAQPAATTVRETTEEDNKAPETDDGAEDKRPDCRNRYRPRAPRPHTKDNVILFPKIPL